MKSRYKIILAIVLIVLIFAVLFSLYGYYNTWRLWNIPVTAPHFADIRTVIAGAEELSKGNDLQTWVRDVNYPRAWQGLYFLGINQTHTTIVGIGFILLFLIGICSFLPNADNATVFMVLAAVVSPAALLAIERANVDLFLFFLISVAIIAAQRSYIVSTLAILIGFILKFFTIFCLTILLKAKKSTFILCVFISLVFAGCYIFLTFSDISLIAKYQPECRIGYGMGVFVRILGDTNVNLGRCAKALSYLLAALSSLFAFSALRRNDNLPGQKEDDIYLSAFRAGAAIYIGTFLLASNFPYRLIFLIFVIPQLVLWAKHSAANIAAISRSAMIAVFMSMWYLMISKLLGLARAPWYVSLTVNALSNWTILFCCMYLIFWSMPEWVKKMVRRK